jgi:hypothetical protein
MDRNIADANGSTHQELKQHVYLLQSGAIPAPDHTDGVFGTNTGANF